MLSDLTINSAKFQPAVVSKEHRETLDAIKSIPRDEPWWEVSHIYIYIYIFGTSLTPLTEQVRSGSWSIAGEKPLVSCDTTQLV
jgi:hypothetical protein